MTNNDKRKVFKFEVFLSNHSNLINLIGVLASLFGLFFAGKLYFKSTHIETDIYNKIDQQINNNIYNDVAYYDVPEYSDYLSKAKSGDTYSQMWVAKHYKEIGKYDDSIYWYINVINSDNKYQAIAYNNLGWLYVNGFGLYECDMYDSKRYDEAFNMFYKASKLGLEEGTRNAVEVAKLPNYYCGTFKSELIKEFLEKNEKNTIKEEDRRVVKSRYYALDVFHGMNYSYRNYHCTYSGYGNCTMTANGIERGCYTYYCSIYNTDGQVDNCVFIYELD